MTKVIFCFLLASFFGLFLISGCGSDGAATFAPQQTPTEIQNNTPSPTSNPSTPTPSPTGATTPVVTVTPNNTPITGSPTPTSIQAGKGVLRIKCFNNNQPIQGKYIEIADLPVGPIGFTEDLNDGDSDQHTWVPNYVNVKTLPPTDANGITEIIVDSNKTYVPFESKNPNGKIDYNEVPFSNTLIANQQITEVLLDGNYKEVTVNSAEVNPSTNLQNDYYGVEHNINGKKYLSNYIDKYNIKKHVSTFKTMTGIPVESKIILKNGSSIASTGSVGNTDLSVLNQNWVDSIHEGVPQNFDLSKMIFPDNSFVKTTTISGIEYRETTANGKDQLCIINNITISQTGEYNFFVNMCYNGPIDSTAKFNVEIISTDGTTWSYQQLPGNSKQITNGKKVGDYYVFSIANKVFFDSTKQYYSKITVFNGVSGTGVSSMSMQKIAQIKWEKVNQLVFEKLDLNIMKRAKEASKVFLP